MQDERQINHHGKVRTVKSSEDAAEEPDKTSTPVENISQLMNKFTTVEGYDRDLVHLDERIQDNALKNLRYAVDRYGESTPTLIRRYSECEKQLTGLKIIVSLLS